MQNKDRLQRQNVVIIIMNIVIVVLCVLLFATGAVMVEELKYAFSDSYNERNMLYNVEHGEYDYLAERCHVLTAEESKVEKSGQEIFGVAHYFEATFFYKAFQETGDTRRANRQKEKMDQAYKEMGEMYDKLAEKEYLSAKMYYNLGTYLGNNYLSAEIVAKNALKDYPTNKHQEDLNWLILQAKYQQVVNSLADKQEERARETEDEYYNFVTEYPDSKHLDAAKRIHKEIQKILNK